MSLVLAIILGLAGCGLSLDGDDGVHCGGRRAIGQSVGPDIVRDAWSGRLKRAARHARSAGQALNLDADHRPQGGRGA
jgi:hypothetical protein